MGITDTSGSRIKYKGYVITGYASQVAPNGAYFYMAPKYNSALVSLSNGLLFDDKYYVGINSGFELIGNSCFFPLALEIMPELYRTGKSRFYFNVSPGYGWGKTTRPKELNQKYQPC